MYHLPNGDQKVSVFVIVRAQPVAIRFPFGGLRILTPAPQAQNDRRVVSCANTL